MKKIYHRKIVSFNATVKFMKALRSPVQNVKIKNEKFILVFLFKFQEIYF